jgi:hypothetical protein
VEGRAGGASGSGEAFGDKLSEPGVEFLLTGVISVFPVTLEICEIFVLFPLFPLFPLTELDDSGIPIPEVSTLDDPNVALPELDALLLLFGVRGGI